MYVKVNARDIREGESARYPVYLIIKAYNFIQSKNEDKLRLLYVRGRTEWSNKRSMHFCWFL